MEERAIVLAARVLYTRGVNDGLYGAQLMGSHPLVLGLRFLLEMAALAALGYWGWTQHEGFLRILWTLGLLLVAGTLWAVFRVPGEGGDPIVAVPGVVRLLLEAALFVTAALLLRAAGQPQLALILGTVVALHYIASYDYVLRLLNLRR